MVAAAVAVAGLLAGCATVPTSGPIRSGTEDGLPQNQPGVGVQAKKPRPNMDDLAVVNGFLEAMDDTVGAREYLTPKAAAQWKPETRTSVYGQSGATSISRRADDTIELSAPLIGTIDERGSWTPAPRDSKLKFAFKLVKVDGQWRVDNAPNGAFLGSNQLDLRLQRFNLYFFNPDRSMLVPDPVYLPRTTSTGRSATQLVQELLKGPTGRLGTSVVSAAPPGAQVNVSVPVDFGVATVALSGNLGALGEDDRRKLAAQIAWTLSPISARVKITVDGAPLLPGEDDEQPFANFGSYDPAVPAGQTSQLYAARGGKIHQLSGLDGSGPIDAVPLLDSLLHEHDAESFAVSLGLDLGAVVPRGDGDDLVVARLAPTDDEENKEWTIPTEGLVVRPSFDAQDRLWILDRADSVAPRLRVWTLEGKVGKEVSVAADFGGLRPTVLRVAPDGVRTLVVGRSATGTAVLTGTFAVDDNKQLTLTRLRPLHLSLQNISDASWYKADEILVAGAIGGGLNRQPWKVKVDGRLPTPLFSASTMDVDRLAASTSSDAPPVVRDRLGALYWQSKDLSWLPVLEPTKQRDDVPVYPG